MEFNVLTHTFHNYHNCWNKPLKGIFLKLANFFWSSVLLLSSTFPDGFAKSLWKVASCNSWVIQVEKEKAQFLETSLPETLEHPQNLIDWVPIKCQDTPHSTSQQP